MISEILDNVGTALNIAVHDSAEGMNPPQKNEKN
jgi:hypothetical protein